MDTSAVERVTVAPFVGGTELERQLAGSLTRRATEIIAGTGNFEMVAFESIQGPYRTGRDISLQVDGIFTGEITSLTVSDSRRQVKYIETLKDGSKAERFKTVYDREVSLSFTYRLLRARDRSVIGTGQSKSGRAGDSGAESKGKLTPALELAEGILGGQLRGLAREVAPWTETINLTLRGLEKPLAKDKAAKALMKEALGAVKRGAYGAAEGLFNQVQEETGSRAAGYDAALMREAQGDVSGAIALMEALGETAAVSRMRSSVASERAVADYQANKDSPVDKAIKEAAGAILAAAAQAFPPGAKVAVLKAGPAGGRGWGPGREHGELLDYAVTGVTEALMEGGLTVVERGENAAAIEAEQDYQYSDAVREEDLVRVGQEYGAAVLIFLSITGSGSARTLKAEAVSVETRAKLYLKTFEI